jgi:hypothetical protein
MLTNPVNQEPNPRRAQPDEERGPVPSGAVGSRTAAVCRCGAGPHPEHQDRCAGGHVIVGNTMAVVTGSRSGAFWRAHEEARREIRDAVISDSGYTVVEAPRVLATIADSIAQSVLVRDAAYARMVEAGGPMTSSGRARRCFQVWAASTDRIEKNARLVGLRRAPKPAPTLAEFLATRESGAEARDR